MSFQKTLPPYLPPAVLSRAGPDDVVPGFGGGGGGGGGSGVNEVPGFGGGGVVSGSGLARTAHRCRRLRMARVCVAGSKVMIGLISGAGCIGRGSVGDDGYEGGGGRSGGEVPVEDRTFRAAGDEDRVHGKPC